MNKYLDGIKTIIFDLDGTIFFKEKLIKGASETVLKLKEQGYNIRFVTNTDSKNRQSLSDMIKAYGMTIPADEIYTCSTAAVEYIKRNKGSVFLLCSDDVSHEFEDIEKNTVDAGYVVIGEFKDKFSYENINTAFRLINAGAELIAMQDSTYYYKADGIYIDTGAFAKMFEYASGKAYISVGKPSKEFFLMATAGLDSKPSETIVVGDDIDSDIQGAHNLGAKGVLVRTGKYNESTLRNSNIKPDLIIDSVADLIS